MNDKNSRCCGDEPGDHALGRSRGGLSTKIHAAVDGRGRPLVVLLTPGQAGDAPMMLPLLAGLRVGRPLGRPRTRQDRVLADKAYSSRAIRAHLRARGIGSVIPEPDDQNAGTAADLYELFWIYPHGFPLAPTPADGVRGFGWPTLAAWILIWAVGLAVAAPTVLARKRRSLPATAGVRT